MSDTEQDIEELREGYHRNREDINDIKTILLGPAPNRDNGVRGDLKKLKEKVNEHRENCIGLEAIEKLEVDMNGKIDAVKSDIESIKSGNTQIAVAKTNLKGVYAIALLTFLGQVLLLVKDLVQPKG